MSSLRFQGQKRFPIDHVTSREGAGFGPNPRPSQTGQVISHRRLRHERVPVAGDDEEPGLAQVRPKSLEIEIRWDGPAPEHQSIATVMAERDPTAGGGRSLREPVELDPRHG